MLKEKPFSTFADLSEKADIAWAGCQKEDVLEAFSHHPMIGDRESIARKFTSTADWTRNEQSSMNEAHQEIIESLVKYNQLYVKKFGYIFIVFATGKSAEEMLNILKDRLNNPAAEEFEIAKAEQHKITQLRLKKLFQ